MQKITLAAVAAIAVATAMAIAPLLSPNAYAVKTVIDTPPECAGDPQQREDCPGHSERGASRDQIEAECSVTGGGDQPVRGQEKKICGED
jgi:hypothetical protein